MIWHVGELNCVISTAVASLVTFCVVFLQGNIYVLQAFVIVQDSGMAYSNLEPRQMRIQEY